jgi:NADPH2:quinone reductase
MSPHPTSRAVVGDTLGPPESYQLRNLDPGQPGPGEVRYAIRAAAISYVDVLIAAGNYQLKPPVPFIPGTECAGIVESVGAGVTDFSPGDRVLSHVFGGTFREAAIAPAKELSHFPKSLDFNEAAAFKVSYLTSYHALVQRGRLQVGETVLVLGAAGAVGYAAIQIAKALGATVIASASSAEKRALAVAGGADVAIDARSPTWRDDLKAANGGKPVDVVVDPIGGDATEPAFRSLAWNGRHLVIGFIGGGIPKLATNLPLLKGASLVGVDIRQFGIFEPELAAANVRALFELQARHHFRPHIGKTFPLEQFAEAMNFAASGECIGRVVLTMQ